MPLNRVPLKMRFHGCRDKFKGAHHLIILSILPPSHDACAALVVSFVISMIKVAFFRITNAPSI